MIRALVFDFDGLILDTETPIIQAYAAVHAKYGVVFDRVAFLRSVGHADYSFDPWHGFSPHADRAALEIERRAIKNELLVNEEVRPGIATLLDTGKKAGLRIGIASNSSHEWVEPHLQRLGLHGYFEFFACRGDAPSPKPEPDLYRMVVNHFGLRGHEAIAFEDSHTGVLAAKRANLWAVAVPGESSLHHDFSHADLRLRSLADITLEELMQKFGGAAASQRA